MGETPTPLEGRGAIRVIRAMTIWEYCQSIEKDGALERRLGFGL